MKAVEREYPFSPKGVVYQEFYAIQHGYWHKETDSYHYMVLEVVGERFYNGITQRDRFGVVEDTPENMTLVAELIDELRIAESGRDVRDNTHWFATGAGKTFDQIAADFWARHGKECDEVFTRIDAVQQSMALPGVNLSAHTKGMWTHHKELMLPEPLPPWRQVKSEDFRRKPRKPGAGRKPVAPGGVKPVTVTLSDADKAALKGIDKNVSEAIRKLIAQNAA